MHFFQNYAPFSTWTFCPLSRTPQKMLAPACGALVFFFLLTVNPSSFHLKSKLCSAVARRSEPFRKYALGPYSPTILKKKNFFFFLSKSCKLECNTISDCCVTFIFIFLCYIHIHILLNIEKSGEQDCAGFLNTPTKSSNQHQKPILDMTFHFLSWNSTSNVVAANFQTELLSIRRPGNSSHGSGATLFSGEEF